MQIKASAGWCYQHRAQWQQRLIPAHSRLEKKKKKEQNKNSREAPKSIWNEAGADEHKIHMKHRLRAMELSTGRGAAAALLNSISETGLRVTHQKTTQSREEEEEADRGRLLPLTGREGRPPPHDLRVKGT